MVNKTLDLSKGAYWYIRHSDKMVWQTFAQLKDMLEHAVHITIQFFIIAEKSVAEFV